MYRLIDNKEGFPAVLMGNEGIVRGPWRLGINRKLVDILF
jgi:hypothetical protein